MVGGLVSSLGLLFTSFASEYHQVFLSYGLLLGKYLFLNILYGSAKLGCGVDKSGCGEDKLWSLASLSWGAA